MEEDRTQLKSLLNTRPGPNSTANNTCCFSNLVGAADGRCLPIITKRLLNILFFFLLWAALLSQPSAAPKGLKLIFKNYWQILFDQCLLNNQCQNFLEIHSWSSASKLSMLRHRDSSSPSSSDRGGYVLGSEWMPTHLIKIHLGMVGLLWGVNYSQIHSVYSSAK